MLRALRDGYALSLDDVALALIGHAAEVHFVGARVGVMDQMAASLATTTAALFLDTRSLAWEPVALPAGAELVVIDSRITHDHATGGYNRRRAECERAARDLGVASLRDVALGDLARVLATLSPRLGRRVRHVVTENARVLSAVTALRADDPGRLGGLLYASHASLRDDYEVSLREIDLLVELALGDVDVYGARVTGGGFGGSIVALARSGTARPAARRICQAYRRRTGRAVRVLVPAES